jgi:phosphatidylinositol-3-phosphatase
MRFFTKASGNALVLTAVIAAAFLMAGCGGVNSNLAAHVGPTPTPAPGSTPNPTPTPVPLPTPTPAPGGGTVPHSAHVVLVIEENHTFAQVLSSMPWLVSQGNAYAYATDYHANEPGSALDYYWLSSGSGEKAFGCSGAGCTQPITSDNIFRELNKAGVSWKVYADSLPRQGYIGGDAGAYVERHNPAKWYSDVISSPALQQNIVPFTQFAADLAANRLPAYSLIIPDVTHDAHDGTLGQADTWLQTNVAPLINSPAFQAGGDGILIVTFDECDGAIGACNQQIYTAVIGPHVKRGFRSALFYQHQSTLRTMMDALGVHVYPGASASAPDMADFFQ